jgi:hypothetical protein
MKVDPKHLQTCRLWEGSNEQISHKYGGLSSSAVLDKIKRLERCDDRTPEENEYLRALKATLKDLRDHL